MLAPLTSALLLLLAVDPVDAAASAPAAQESDAPNDADAPAPPSPSAAPPAIPAVSAPAASLAPPDPLQPLKDAMLRAFAVARRGGPPEKALPGATSLERFVAALSEPSDDIAWPLFKQLSLEFPKEPWGDIGMGHVYVRWHIRDQAEKSFARALKIAPQHPIALVERAVSERIFGDATAAKADAEQVLARDANDARALLLLAQLADDAGANKDELRQAYQRALNASADLYEARLWLAAAAEASGDTVAALEAVEALSQMNPRDVPTLRKLAALRRARGNYAGAVVAYEAAVGRGDATKDTWSGLAACKRALKDTAGEEQALRRWRRIDPRDRNIVVRLFNLRVAAHDGAGIEEFARALLGFDAKDAGAHLTLATRRGEASDLLGQLDELKAAAAGSTHPEAKGAVERARAELAALRSRLQLPARPLVAANPDGIYNVSSRHLTELYEQRRALKPELAGKITVVLKISSAGSSDAVEVTEDTLHEPELTQQLVAALREGEWPKAKKSLTLKYELAPPRKHMVEVVEQPRRKSKEKPVAAPARVTGVGGL